MTQSTETARRRIRRRRIAAVVVAGIVLVAGGAAVAGVLRLQTNVQTAPLREEGSTPPPLPTEGQNILLLGTDSRTGLGEGARSDAMVLLHLAESDARVEAVQIPRDTLVQLPPCAGGGGGYGMMNAALNDGPSCSVAAVESMTGVTIDHFVEVDFAGFANMVDALGGLPVCLPEPLYDTHAGLDLQAGTQTVSGSDALALARTRHSIGDGSDISRLGHQQMVMSALAQRAVSAETLARPDRILAFLDAVSSSMTVDPGLASVPDLVVLVSRLLRVPTEQITFVVMPWEVSPEDPNRVVPAADADVVFSHLANDTPIVFADDQSHDAVADVDDAAEFGGSGASDDGPEESVNPESGVDADIAETPQVEATHRNAQAPLCEG